MNLLAIISNLRFQDALDILFLTAVTYYLYLWFRGTKAFKAIVGLAVLGSLGALPDYLGISDILAGSYHLAHYPLSIGDPPGAGTGQSLEGHQISQDSRPGRMGAGLYKGRVLTG
ncbi:MAG: hypothetical protein JRJ06_09305 [Deltaproteobacteria bacterium]|nr:hypothetical protein [Deltaproteobacteria bacterium]